MVSAAGVARCRGTSDRARSFSPPTSMERIWFRRPGTAAKDVTLSRARNSGPWSPVQPNSLTL